MSAPKFSSRVEHDMIGKRTNGQHDQVVRFGTCGLVENSSFLCEGKTDDVECTDDGTVPLLLPRPPNSKQSGISPNCSVVLDPERQSLDSRAHTIRFVGSVKSREF